MPALRRQREVHHQEVCQVSLVYMEFQDIQGYKVRPCLKTSKAGHVMEYFQICSLEDTKRKPFASCTSSLAWRSTFSLLQSCFLSITLSLKTALPNQVSHRFQVDASLGPPFYTQAPSWGSLVPSAWHLTSLLLLPPRLWLC